MHHTHTVDQLRARQQREHDNRRRYAAELATFGDGSTCVGVEYRVPRSMDYGTVHQWPRERATRQPSSWGDSIIVPSDAQAAQLREARAMAELAQRWEDAAHPAPDPLPCHYCGHPDPSSLRSTCC